MKLKLTLITILLCGFNANSQELSLNFDIGYGLGIAPAAIPDGNAQRLSDIEAEYSTLRYSFGKGINVNSELNLTLGEHIGLGLGAGYLQGARITSLRDRPDIIFQLTNTATMLRFFPFVKFRFQQNKLTYYTKMGYLLGVLGEINQEYYTTHFLGDNYYSKTVFNEGLSHGVITGLGMQYQLSNRISINGEIRMFIQSFGPRKGEVVTRENNGKDQLPDLKEGQIHFNYVDKYTKHWFSSADLDKPSTLLRWYYPFSSMGINVGIEYKFGPKQFKNL